MATNTLNILKPSVNNLTVRIFVRAAGLDFEEQDVGQETRVPGEVPGAADADAGGGGASEGALGESCAIMAYLCNKHGLEQFYPSDPGKRAMVDNAMFYLIGTLYPLLTRATYPALGFPQYPGEVATSDADDAMKEKAQQDAEAALEPLEVYNTFFLDGQQFIGGDSPSIADFRFAATLEFLRAIDYDFPAWAEEYMSRMEETLGERTRSLSRTSGLHRLREVGGGHDRVNSGDRSDARRLKLLPRLGRTGRGVFSSDSSFVGQGRSPRRPSRPPIGRTTSFERTGWSGVRSLAWTLRPCGDHRRLRRSARRRRRDSMGSQAAT